MVTPRRGNISLLTYEKCMMDGIILEKWHLKARVALRCPCYTCPLHAARPPALHVTDPLLTGASPSASRHTNEASALSREREGAEDPLL